MLGQQLHTIFIYLTTRIRRLRRNYEDEMVSVMKDIVSLREKAEKAQKNVDKKQTQIVLRSCKQKLIKIREQIQENYNQQKQLYGQCRKRVHIDPIAYKESLQNKEINQNQNKQTNNVKNNLQKNQQLCKKINFNRQILHFLISRNKNQSALQLLESLPQEETYYKFQLKVLLRASQISNQIVKNNLRPLKNWCFQHSHHLTKMKSQLQFKLIACQYINILNSSRQAKAIEFLRKSVCTLLNSNFNENERKQLSSLTLMTLINDNKLTDEQIQKRQTQAKRIKKKKEAQKNRHNERLNPPRRRRVNQITNERITMNRLINFRQNMVRRTRMNLREAFMRIQPFRTQELDFQQILRSESQQNPFELLSQVESIIQIQEDQPAQPVQPIQRNILDYIQAPSSQRIQEQPINIERSPPNAPTLWHMIQNTLNPSIPEVRNQNDTIQNQNLDNRQANEDIHQNNQIFSLDNRKNSQFQLRINKQHSTFRQPQKQIQKNEQMKVKQNSTHKLVNRNKLIDYLTETNHLFNDAFTSIYKIPRQALLSRTIGAGVAVLKTSACSLHKQQQKSSKKLIKDQKTTLSPCPICTKQGQKLAAKVPNLSTNQSTIICRINKSYMNQVNYPVALPNGRIYSISGLKSTMKNGKYYCLKQNRYFNIDKCKRVFLT